MNGVDISEHQKGIDFDVLKQNVDFVILRIGYTGYGTSKAIKADSCFETFYKECKKRGIPVGAYYYSLATTPTEAVKESEFVLKQLEGKQFEYPIYWDTEEPAEMKKYHDVRPSTIGKSDLSYVGKLFMQQIERQGYYVGIYGSSDWLKNKLDMDELKSFDVWVAHHGVEKPSYTGPYGMWQYTSSLKIDGHNVDGNKAYKNYPEIIKAALLNGFKEIDYKAFYDKYHELITKIKEA